jgi:hypothetical protein
MHRQVWGTTHRLGIAALLAAAALGGCGGGGSAYGSPPPPPPVTCSGATPVALTVKNYLAWCAVSVAGHPASSGATQTVCVGAGAVPVAASALVGFELGPAPWHDTDGDHGSGDPGTVTGSGQAATSATTVTVAGATACAWVCCPFTSGLGCPAVNQCP